MIKRANTKGFTLVELSIVIVIIGLIVAGVVGGQSLVKQAKLRSIVQDISSYRVAMNSFVLEYGELPGDLSNAQSYWPSCTDAGSNTCNGDGDKWIDSGGGPNAPYEDIRFWQHLSLSGIIPGNYTGLYIALQRHEPGITVPFTPYGGSEIGYRIGSDGTGWAYGYNGNFIMIAAQESSAGASTESVMSSVDALSIDSKTDDGLPGSGEVLFGRGGETSGSGCVSIYWSAGTNPTLLSPMDKNITCRMLFKF